MRYKVNIWKSLCNRNDNRIKMIKIILLKVLIYKQLKKDKKNRRILTRIKNSYII